MLEETGNLYDFLCLAAAEGDCHLLMQPEGSGKGNLCFMTVS